MRLLRILAAPGEGVGRCSWVLRESGRSAQTGEGGIADLPLPADRIELVIGAGQVRFTRVRLPPGNAHPAGELLVFAVEEETLGEPEAQHAINLGTRDGEQVLAVIGREYLRQWEEAMLQAGAGRVDVTCESLLLPRVEGSWSLAWDGREGFLRTGEFEGAATDSGSAASPPLALELALRSGEYGKPAAIRVFPATAAAAPDAAAWTNLLGLPVQTGETWDWRGAASDVAPVLFRFGSRWQAMAGVAARLRGAAWIAALALTCHGVALALDWARLAGQARETRARMEASFRALYPEAVAVADPVLQMRRKLTEARHVAGQADAADFRPAAEHVARALAALPAGRLRTLSYEGGRLRLEIAGVDQAALRPVVLRLEQAGFAVEPLPGALASGARVMVLVARMP